eukprot:Phypoly_transcript_00507.p1 GENE.Phypoly_transcript_00507~~Phypoly_transcript_00507.p1  ORF type:complete len:1486 (-),score=358.20 Phypoly_transcript_00507:52-4509(-)
MAVVNACCEEWKAKLAQCESTCTKLTGNAQLLKTKIIDTSTLLGLHRQLQSKLKESADELAEAKKQNASLQKLLETEKRESVSLKEQVDFLLASNAPTESKLEETTAQLEATSAKLAEKEAYVTQLEASVSAGKEALLNYDKVVKESARLRAELSNREIMYKDAKKNVKLQETAVAELRIQVGHLTDELDAANNTILSLELELSMLKDKKEPEAICWESVEPIVEPSSAISAISASPMSVSSVVPSSPFASVSSGSVVPSSASFEPIDDFAVDLAGDLEDSLEVVRRPNMDLSFCDGTPAKRRPKSGDRRVSLSKSASGAMKIQRMGLPAIVSKEPSPETSPPHKRTIAENRQRISRSYDEPSPSSVFPSPEVSPRSPSPPPISHLPSTPPPPSPPSHQPEVDFMPTFSSPTASPTPTPTQTNISAPILPPKTPANISIQTKPAEKSTPARPLARPALDAEMPDATPGVSAQPLVPIVSPSSWPMTIRPPPQQAPPPPSHFLPTPPLKSTSRKPETQHKRSETKHAEPEPLRTRPKLAEPTPTAEPTQTHLEPKHTQQEPTHTNLKPTHTRAEPTQPTPTAEPDLSKSLAAESDQSKKPLEQHTQAEPIQGPVVQEASSIAAELLEPASAPPAVVSLPAKPSEPAAVVTSEQGTLPTEQPILSSEPTLEISVSLEPALTPSKPTEPTSSLSEPTPAPLEPVPVPSQLPVPEHQSEWEQFEWEEERESGSSEPVAVPSEPVPVPLEPTIVAESKDAEKEAEQPKGSELVPMPLEPVLVLPEPTIALPKASDPEREQEVLEREKDECKEEVHEDPELASLSPAPPEPAPTSSEPDQVPQEPVSAPLRAAPVPENQSEWENVEWEKVGGEEVPKDAEPAPVPSEQAPSEPAPSPLEPEPTPLEPAPFPSELAPSEPATTLLEPVQEPEPIVTRPQIPAPEIQESELANGTRQEKLAESSEVTGPKAGVEGGEEWEEEEQLEEGQIDARGEEIEQKRKEDTKRENGAALPRKAKKSRKPKKASAKRARLQADDQIGQQGSAYKRKRDDRDGGEDEPESKKMESTNMDQHPIISSLLFGISRSVEIDPPLSPSLLPDDPIESEWEVNKEPRPNEPLFDYLCRRISLVFAPPSLGLSLAALNSCDDLFNYDIYYKHMDIVVLAFLKVLHESNATSKVETATLLFWQFFSFQPEKGMEFRNLFLNKISEYLVHSASFSSIAYMCELFAGICKSNNDMERFVFLAYKILRKNSFWKIRTLAALAQCWPDPLIGKGDNLPLLNAIENLVALSSANRSNPEYQQEQEAYQTLRRACYWPCRNNPEKISLEVLVSDLTQALVRCAEDPDMDAREGMFPHRMETVIQAFELISVHKVHDWDWTYQTIMVPMWGILSPTYPKHPNLTPAVLRLLGIVGRVYSSEQMVEVRSRIALVFTPYALQNYAFSVQVCAALSLFDLCKGDTQILAPCKEWYRNLDRDKKNQLRHLTYLVDYCAK